MPTSKGVDATWRNHYAGFASRLVAVIIDILILCVALAVTTTLYNVVISNLLAASRIVLGRDISVPSHAASVIITVLMVLIVFAVYFIFLWTVIGTTIGGLILGIKIVNRSGKNPGFWRALLRFTFEFFFFVFGIFASLWILFNGQRRALFDMIAGTYVVYAWDAKPDEIFLKQATDEIVEGVYRENRRNQE